MSRGGEGECNEFVKPLFIPLRREYFEAFDNGKKDTEYRLYGPRWNERTCVVGRPVILSLGKQRRLNGVITSFECKLAQRSKGGAVASLIYGMRKGYSIAEIGIAVTRR